MDQRTLGGAGMKDVRTPVCSGFIAGELALILVHPFRKCLNFSCTCVTLNTSRSFTKFLTFEAFSPLQDVRIS